MDRRLFCSLPLALLAEAKTVAAAEPAIADLAARMKSGRTSAVALTRQYLAAIEQIDRKGPLLRSVIETNPDALKIAAELDAERKAKGVRGPLHGLPVLVKDNLDTGDRMQTTAGSLALLGRPAPRDATVVAKLRAAGAVILGKTNLSEWANIRSSKSTSGWSGRGGQTRNPYMLDRNPSGSSSGSGVAVSAGLCVAAIGTETDGSIVSPASVSGIVGIKPTVGLVSRAGIIPISHTQDTAGPMARTVADAAAVLTAIAGVDERDAATRAAQGHIERDYTAFLQADGLRGARIGVARQLFGFHREVDAVMAKAIAVLKQQGAEIVDPVEFPSWRKMGNAELDIMLYELKAGLAAYLATRGETAQVKSLADVIAFNEKNADKELAVFGQELFLQAQKLGDLGEKRYRDAVERCRKGSREDGIDAVLQKHKLDAIVGPTDGPAWKTDWVNGDNYSGGSSAYPAMAGYPHVTVPAGFVRGLPVGLSFFSTAWTEGKLIQYAYAFEQAAKARRAPGFEGPKGV